MSAPLIIYIIANNIPCIPQSLGMYCVHLCHGLALLWHAIWVNHPRWFPTRPWNKHTIYKHNNPTKLISSDTWRVNSMRAVRSPGELHECVNLLFNQYGYNQYWYYTYFVKEYGDLVIFNRIHHASENWEVRTAFTSIWVYILHNIVQRMWYQYIGMPITLCHVIISLNHLRWYDSDTHIKLLLIKAYE